MINKIIKDDKKKQKLMKKGYLEMTEESFIITKEWESVDLE